MADLRAFIESRRKQIQEEYEPLLERRKALRSQLDEVIARLALLRRELDEIDRADQAIGSSGQSMPRARPTIKEAVLTVLEKEPRGLTAQQILTAINERFFEGEIVRSSLSPQLSRLNHDDHRVKYESGVWSLRTQNDEGPTSAEPSFLD